MKNITMTDNQAKAEEYLSLIRRKVKNLQSIMLEIEALEYAASGMGAIRYDKDHVDGNSGKDRLIEFISDALNKRAELEEESAELDVLKIESYHLIKQLENADERILLEWYYINGIKMETIQHKIHVSERKAYYIRDDALEHFGELLN